MQRRARTRLAGAALACAVVGGLTACTGTSGESGADAGSDGATAVAEPAPPGRFRTLPEPCGAVSRDTLEQMLPGAAAKAEAHAEDAGEDDTADTPSPFDGEAHLTYDTDRRVGCTWQSTTSLGSRRLTVDFQRIVSYDPEMSDDRQAELLFAKRAAKAGIGPGPEEEPEPGGSATETEAEAENGDDADADTENGAADGGPSGGAEPGGGGAEAHAESRVAARGAQHAASDGPSDGPSDESSDESSDEPSGGPSPDDGKADGGVELASPSPEPSLPPRTLEDIGDAAFIDDRLKTAADGRGSHRDITLVFRAANVLVTVEYSQSIADGRRTPDSAELQDYAQNLARQLAEQLADS